MKSSSRPSKNFWLKLAMALSFAFSQTVAASACVEELVQNCESMNASVKAKLAGSYVPSKSQPLNVALQANGLNQAGQLGQQAASICENQDCNSCAEPDRQKCQKAISAVASRMRTEAIGFRQTGSDFSSYLPLLVGVGGAAAMVMMANSNKSPPPPQPLPQQQSPAQPTGALNLDGSLNCQMADSYKYADCDNFLAGACTNLAAASAAAPAGVGQTPVTGAVIQTAAGTGAQPDCAAFTARYCSSSFTPPQGMGYHVPNGQVTQLNMAGSGEGYSTPYCQRVWCTADGSHAACPMCQQMSTGGCATNPAACLATSNMTVASCQGFPQGAPSPSAGTAVAGQTPGVSAGGALPGAGTGAAVPSSAQLPVAGGSNAVAAGGTSQAPGFRTVSTASASGTPTDAATREGAGGRNPAAAAGSSADSASAGGSGGTPAGYRMASLNSELIAAGGVIVKREAAGVDSSGPAPDVPGLFGPSLFVTSSQVIQQRCQAGMLNCP